MAALKIVIYGSSNFPADRLNSLHSNQVEIVRVSGNYPISSLDKIAPFQMVLLNFAAESEATLEQIAALRRKYVSVPLILASSNPTVSYLVQAYRHGITDCLLAPYNEEQLNSQLSPYLTKPEFPVVQQRTELMPQLMRSALNPVNNHLEADFSANFLGTFRLFRNGEALDLPGGARQRSLLAYLLFYAQSQVHRDKIIQSFWPDHDPDCAKNNLNVAICNLRRYLEQFIQEDVICFHNGYFFLNPDLVIHRDIDHFLHAYHQGRVAESRGQTTEAAGLFQAAIQTGSEFLEEFMQDDWTLRPREEFTEKLFHALDQVSAQQYENNCFEAALTTLRYMLYKDDCLESVHNKMMSCYLALGKNEKAVRQYQDCERILQTKLKMRPSAETEALYYTARGQALVA